MTAALNDLRLHPLNDEVEQLFGRWRVQRQLLADHMVALEGLVQRFRRGVAPEPIQQRAFVEELQGECDKLLMHASAALEAAQEAGVR